MNDDDKKRTKKNVLCKGKFISMVSKGGWEYVERVNCTGAVVIVPLTDDQHVIFVRTISPSS